MAPGSVTSPRIPAPSLIGSDPKREARLRRSARWHKIDRRVSPYLYISPFYLMFALVGLFPLVFMAYISTRQWNVAMGDQGVAVCGLTCPSIGNAPAWYANFLWVLHQPDFWTALRNTCAIFLISTIPQLILALAIAYVLSAKLRGATFWRMGVLLPYVLAPMALAIIFSQVFSDNLGLANTVLSALHLPTVAWHTKPLAAWIAIAVIVNIRWTGYNALILLAAMLAVPSELIEAAEVDGASPIRQLLFITIPQLRPTLVFVIITSTIGGLQIFDEPQMFSPSSNFGGSSQQYLTITQFLWRTGFMSQNNAGLGRAAAMGWLLFLLVIVLVILNFALTRRIAGPDVPREPGRSRRRPGATRPADAASTGGAR
ncbi:MAG: sugar ABC transporter permease [Actinomycetia bacterium]|nr:sugar ABC transporter permease [Actinomycetes bacterium]